MDRQVLIEKIHSIQTANDLLNLLNEIKADLLGSSAYPFTKKNMFILCNPKKVKGRYINFSIPKKTGGERVISAPSGNLKWMQMCLNEIFKVLYTASPYAMGFAEGRSVVENAKIHTNQNYVFNIDLKDFFPSIDQARIWKRLQLSPFHFNTKVASIIAGLCCMKIMRNSNELSLEEAYVLPQGAPTSPLLTNAICDTLDRRLHGLAKRFGLHYSRYADDITFSSMHNVYQPCSDFRKELERIITEQRFTINAKKTRLQHCSKRQEVTGITVGSKLNVTRKYVKDLRAILHIWERYGINAAYAAFYPRYKSEKCQLHRGEPNIVNVLSGKLCYLKMVKGENDSVYTRLYTQFSRLVDEPIKVVPPNDIDYLFTMSLLEFEKKYSIKMEFRKRKRDNKPYGMFSFQNRTFIVAISKNLDVNCLPGNVMISLARTAMDNTIESSIAGQLNPEIKVGYLLHKPHSGKRQKDCTIIHNDAGISGDLSELFLRGVDSFSEYGWKSEVDTKEINQEEDLLSILVDSNFDLSILP